jgi:polysaccharide deacetylase family protein (PEP-CTERM system associated)
MVQSTPILPARPLAPGLRGGDAPDRAAGTGTAARCVFSVDVEDWFHILDVPAAPPISQWCSLPSRVETSFRRLLELFDELGARVTCFFLGWVAERYPHLVTEAAKRGHEIASHGYAHRLVYECTEKEFRADVEKAKDILEQASGERVLGYRSPGFSCTEDVPWFFDALVETGHHYDSSVFPAPRGHGGMAIDELGPHVIPVNGSRLIEFPISVARFAGRRVCLFGGGYLRLFPYPLIRRMARQVLEEGRPVVFYIHPREIDPEHPRLPMSLTRRFKSYVNLHTTEPKVRSILRDFPATTFRQFIEDTPALAEAR